MTLAAPTSLGAFDAAAWAEIRALLHSNQARVALERLRLYEPRDREQRINFHGLTASAYDNVGEFDEAIQHWVRALRLTSQFKALRPRVRTCFAETLICVGGLSLGERVAQRCVAEIRADGDGRPYEPWALSVLARIHFHRGTLSLAVRLFESTLALEVDPAEDPTFWSGIQVNYVLALMRLGELARADAVLSDSESSGLALEADRIAPLTLTRALWGLESGNLDVCERALGRVSDRIVGDYLRYQLVRLEFMALLAIERGRPEDALAPLDEAFRMAPSTDHMMTRLLRARATALLAVGRAPEALDAAQEAIRSGRGSDMIDHPAALRIAGRCLGANGRRDEARALLAKALSLLQSTEFVMERGRLYQEMQALGMPGIPESRPVDVSTVVRRGRVRPPVHRFELRDGRRFLTTDGELVDRIQAATENRLPVLIEGETGTGKELVSRLLHEKGPSREGPLVVVDCTTLTDGLAEGELFGAARGAYTGAISDRIGLVGAADRGTLLFDELPELSLPAQSKLLRLLQEGTYRRLGEARARHVQVRVIATTNRDAERLLALGTLKADLFFRLHGYRIRLLPLRDRPRDIALLAEEFANTAGLAGVTQEALNELQSFGWPGNARQLEMLVHVAASSVGKGRWLDKPLVVRLLEESPKVPEPSAERQRLKLALDSHSGNIAATARDVGMSRQGLYKALRRHGLI